MQVMRKSGEVRHSLVKNDRRYYYKAVAIVFETFRIAFAASVIVFLSNIEYAKSMSVSKHSSNLPQFPHGGSNRYNYAAVNRFGLRPPQRIPQRPVADLKKGRNDYTIKYPTITYYSDDVQQEGLVVRSQLPDTEQAISSKCVCGAFHIEFLVSKVIQSPADANFFSTSPTATQSSSASEYYTNDNNLIQQCRRTAAIDCHCAACRKYHVAAFASYLQVSKNDIKFVGEHTYNAVAYYKDYCSSGWGIPCSSNTRIPVNRVYCKYCSSKMYTEPLYTPKWMQTTEHSGTSSPLVLLNMGPIDDETIPYSLEQQWKNQVQVTDAHHESHRASSFQPSMEHRQLQAQTGRIQWKVSETAPWTWSIPKYRPDVSSSSYHRHYNTQQTPLQGYYATDAIDEYENDYYNSTWSLHGASNTFAVADEAKPEFESDPVITVKGGCTCGKCQYQIQFQTPSELQHCYCHLCRQLSGSAFMTWIPIPLIDFEWTHLPPPLKALLDENDAYWENNDDEVVGILDKKSAEHILQRFTDHGRRHVCPTCRSVMTISYDDDYDNAIWIAAATMDNIYLPSVYDAMSHYLERVVHICCVAQQAWYELPDDGMMRIDNAS
jgi:hypothetical protein